MDSPKIDAFDLSGESAATLAKYGDTDFGRGCLVARRLVERGVKFVEVVLDGWDTHQNDFDRTQKLMATLDPAFAALLDDLGERKRLGSTLVACMGEFGRTPRINANDGRDHWPGAWSAVLAGAGIKGGTVHGATDDDGARVTGPTTGVPDLLATMATICRPRPGSYRDDAGRPPHLRDRHGLAPARGDDLTPSTGGVRRPRVRGRRGSGCHRRSRRPGRSFRPRA